MNRNMMLCTAIVLMLTLSGLLAIHASEAGMPSKAAPIVMTNVHVNVTYPNASAAVNVDVYLHYHTYTYKQESVKGKTDVNGKVTLGASTNQLGPCYVSVANSTLMAFVREPLYIWPGKEYYVDIVLENGLPYSYTLSGVVRNMSTDMPLSDARVTFKGADARGRSIELSCDTNVMGEYSFSFPYSNRPYKVHAFNQSMSSNEYDANFYTIASVYSYTEDILLRPFPQRQPLNIRAVDRVSGRPLEGGDVYVSGAASGDDHDPWIVYNGDLYGTNGWVNLSVYWGEYTGTVGSEKWVTHGSIYVGSTFGIIMNDTPTEMIVDLSIPSTWRNITFNVSDSSNGALLSDVNLEVPFSIRDEPGYDTELYVLCYTNMSGECVLPILPGAEAEVRIERYDHLVEYVTVPAGPFDDNPTIYVQLDPEPPYTADEGNISVLVIDGTTGEPMPQATVSIERHYGTYSSTYYPSTGANGYMNLTEEEAVYILRALTRLGKSRAVEVEVIAGQNTSVTLVIEDYYQYTAGLVYEYSFKVVDELGYGIPYESLLLYCFAGGTYRSESDADGIVRWTGPSGEYRIEVDIYSIRGQRRAHYSAVDNLRITAPVGGGSLSDVILFPTDPLEEITGYVKDEVTRSPIQAANVFAHSEMYISRGSDVRDMPPARDTPNVFLYAQSSTTTSEGYYRNWGRNFVEIDVEAEGYFPEKASLDMGTRSAVKDFYLEPLLPYSTFVNGTIVDSNDDPVKGFLTFYDLDREGYFAADAANEDDGTFSVAIYPGRFQVYYGNESEREELEELVVPAEGVNDLRLVVVFESTIKGRVTDWNGVPQVGINVTLLSVGDTSETMQDFNLTDEYGDYSFDVMAGVYRIYIEYTDNFDTYSSDRLIANSFDDIHHDVRLANRTLGKLFGVISGALPGLEGPVPDVLVSLNDGSNTTISTCITDEEGKYSFQDLEYYADLYLYIEPPVGLSPDEGTSRSGYLPLLYGPFALSMSETSIDLELQYIEFPAPGFYNITSYSPTGTDVFLNEPIVVSFSTAMNVSTLEGNFSMSPAVGGPSFIWSEGDRTLTVLHDDFDANMTYTVTVSRNLLSANGSRIWTGTDLEWSFTTGDTAVEWQIYSAEVTVDDDRTVNVEASGITGMQVYIVIDEVGSFILEEQPLGTYTATIAADNLDWDRTYSYYFSDTENGTDLAPTLAGTFNTPVEPVVEEITSADVTVDDDGNWHVEVEGTPGMTLYIVIDDVGSFLLEETSPGIYEAVIDADEFEWEQDYTYHFSTTSGGAPLPGWDQYSDSLTMPKEPEEQGTAWYWYMGCCLLVVLIIIIMLVIVLVLIMARKKGEGAEE